MVIFGKLAKLLLCYKRYVLTHPGLHLPLRSTVVFLQGGTGCSRNPQSLARGVAHGGPTSYYFVQRLLYDKDSISITVTSVSISRSIARRIAPRVRVRVTVLRLPCRGCLEVASIEFTVSVEH